MIVTIDGPAGSGKSTAARGLAERLGFDFLDTGAMYRVVALCCLERDISATDRVAVTEAAQTIDMQVRDGHTLMNDHDVTAAIRSPEVTEAASLVAGIEGVRDELVDWQRQAASEKDIVTEGRDQGTVVFPEAECKFFLTAAPEVRARRRQQDLERTGVTVDFEEMLRLIHERDNRDASRNVAPLKPAADARHVDTSELSADGMLDLLEKVVRERMAAQRD
jgi:cytidylate kinase